MSDINEGDYEDALPEEGESEEELHAQDTLREIGYELARKHQMDRQDEAVTYQSLLAERTAREGQLAKSSQEAINRLTADTERAKEAIILNFIVGGFTGQVGDLKIVQGPKLNCFVLKSGNVAVVSRIVQNPLAPVFVVYSGEYMDRVVGQLNKFVKAWVSTWDLLNTQY